MDVLRRYLGERGLVIALPATLALSYLLLGAYSSTLGVALLLVQNIANGVYSPLSKDLLNREIADSSQRATVLSVESMVRRLAFAGFAPLVGVVIDRAGLSGGLYVCATLGIVGSIALGFHVARRRVTFGQGFEGERTPTPLPEPDRSLLVPVERSQPLVAAISRVAD